MQPLNAATTKASLRNHASHRQSAGMGVLVACLMLGLAMLGLAGCNPSRESKPSAGSAGAASAKPKIALIMKSLANEFFSTMADGAKKHQSAHADRYELIVNGIKDERDLARQAALVDEMVAAGVRAIVIAPADSKALIPSLKKATQAGVRVVNIDNQLDREILAAESVRVPFVGPNNLLGAKKVGEYLASKLQKGDEVAILEGIRTSFNGTQRRLGFEQAMSDAGMKIVASQSGQWETNQANTITASMLSEHPNLKAVLAANDSMALGAIAAIKSANKTDSVYVVGFDNITAAREAILEGKMLATAEQHGDQLAVYGIEAALEMLTQEEAVSDLRETPVELVTAEELRDKK